jgi:hypothetical protein
MITPSSQERALMSARRRAPPMSWRSPPGDGCYLYEA